MPDSGTNQPLSQLSTNWSQLLEAQGSGEAARAAQAVVLRRYDRAITAYLAAATGDPHAAADLSQDFALRFLRGDFRNLDPERGRFRRFLRTVLYNLVIDHFRSRKSAPGTLPGDSAEIAPAGPSGEDFDRRWREELLRRAWEELKRDDRAGGAPYFHALLWRVHNPDRPLSEGADALTERLGRRVRPETYRQTLHRAREKFAAYLRAEVAYSIGTEVADAVDEELAELKLLTYCRPT